MSHAADRVAWPLTLKQTASLLKHRCAVICCDVVVDEAELCSGDARGCMAILRFLFTRFSEGLTLYLEDQGHYFDPSIKDHELAQRIFAAWPLVSPLPSLGGATADKLLSSKWVADRLLFALQCIIVCTDKACELADAASRDGSKRSVMSLGSTGLMSSQAQSVFGDSLPQARDSNQMQGTLQWMAQVYREQLKTIDGAAQQQEWVNALRANDAPLLDAREQQLYRTQLGQDGEALRPAAAAGEGPGRYAQHMRNLDLVGENGGLEQRDQRADARLDTPFIDD
tara:strand:- start:160 stop:1008 length:849 start_codon:yes stop_codon:yes gene_type:complete